MKLSDYLLEEVQLATESDNIKNLQKIFNYGLKQVYSESFLPKVEEAIKNKVRLREKVSSKINEVAWIDNFNVIYINPPPFYSQTKENQVRIILHEFIHLLHSSRKFLFFKNFPEMKKLSSFLFRRVKSGLNRGSSVGEFLANKKNASSKYINREEVLAYLMTGSVNWNSITKEAKEDIIKALQDSGMFNLSSDFWRKRLTA